MLVYENVCVCMNGLGSLKIHSLFVESLTLMPSLTAHFCSFSVSCSHAFLISHTQACIHCRGFEKRQKSPIF